VDSDGSEFDFKKYKDLSISELIKKKVLPDINGIYKDSEELLDAVLISHPHQDHYGFVNYIHEDLKYFLGEAAFGIINTSNLFTGKDLWFKNHSFFKKELPFSIGDITVTPYWMDHSAFDSYAFLIESDGKKIFYSGDFRGHGRKSKAFHWFLHHAPKDIQYLLLEGTMIGRSFSDEKTENEILYEFEKILSGDQVNLVYTSGQNIDRLVSIYKACNKVHKTLVIDPYIASILKEASKTSSIHHPSDKFKNIKVLFPRFLTGRMLKTPYKNLIYKFKSFKITADQINKDPGKYVLVVRPSMKFDLDKMPGINGGNFIYSLWDGYLKKSPTKEFVDYLQNRNFILHKVHTSGHADINTLKQMVKAINPKYIVPIHTFHGSDYKDIFKTPVVELADGEDRYLE
jgi:ribonuclease J